MYNRSLALQQNYMFTQRKRQQSLKEFPALKKYQTFTQSPKILPTISQYRQTKKNSTKDLTNVIAKFTNNNNKQNLKHSEQLLRSALGVLQGFSQTQNNFQSLFSHLYEVFKRYSFAIDDQEINIILHAYKVREGFSFRRTCILLQKQLDNVMNDKNQKLKLIAQQLSTLKTIFESAKTQWANEKRFLQSQVERYRKLADIQYMRSLQEKVQSLKTTVTQLQIQTTKLGKQNDEFLKQIDFKDNKIHDQAYEIAKLKADLFDARDKIDHTQIYFNQMRDRFDGLLVKMMGLKEIIAKVEEENGILVSERMKMVNRAAVAFEQLTPRPKYSQIFGINIRNNGISTNDIFARLVEQSENSKKSIIQIMKQKRKNQKLHEAQALRDKVVDDIILAKKDMEKVQKM